ncbi:MAG: glycosyltransferase family 4 protein [Thermodesulfobacteriota bacterium]
MDEPTIGLILKGYPRISETFISNEILLLEEMGFRFHIFSMRKPRESFSHKSVSRIRATVDYLPETILRGLGMFLASSARLAWSRPTVFRAAWGLAGRRFQRTRKSASIKHILQAGYLVDRLLPRYALDRFHAHFAHSPTSVALYASILSGIPFGFTAHAKDIYTSDPTQLAEKIDRAEFVVTCTEYNRSHLGQLPTTGRTPLFRVYHGIDLGLFRSNDVPIRPTPPYRLLTVARLTAKKGIRTVLSALGLLMNRGLDFRYTVIGEGEEREYLMRMAADLGLQGRVTWMGTQPHDVVLDYYRDSDVFAIGCEVVTNGDRDGIPNVLAESMAMGVPVVATRVSAIPELVEHGISGLLVEPGESLAMAEAIQRLLLDEALRSRMIAAAKQAVSERFDNRKWIRRLADIYRHPNSWFSVSE